MTHRLKYSSYIFIIFLLVSTGSVADILSDKDSAINPIIPHNWTGFYAGGNIGVVKHTMNVTDNQATSFNATIQEVSNPRLTGGLQLGYRRQTDYSNITGIYGLEFSTEFNQIDFTQQYGSPYALYEITAQNKLKNTYLLQLLGGIAANKTLFFFAAGFAWSDLNGNMVETNGSPYFSSFSVNNTPFGTALGGGVEYAWTKSLSTRIKVDVITPNTYTAVDNLENNFSISNSIVQGLFGINYTWH